MTDSHASSPASSQGFSSSFWSANISELFERIAFYGMTPMLVVYLTEARGFDADTAIAIGGNFGLATYGLAAISGFVADSLGYRRALLLAYGLLTLGYALTGQAHSSLAIMGSLLCVALGASLVKPIITGTVQKGCSESRRAIGFSIYYTLVNIGGFLGPNLSAQVRSRFGAELVFVTSAGVGLLALVLVLFFYREPLESDPAPKRRVSEFLGDFGRVVSNPKLVTLFLLVAGWWSMFFAFMNVLPLYLRDDLQVSPWLLGFVPSLESLAVICLQVVVGIAVRKMQPFKAILLAVLLSSGGVALMGVMPLVQFAALGIVIFALGEMIYSAHFYHYLGNIAPKGQVGMYMGFAFLPIALGSFISGQIGGPIANLFRNRLQVPEMMWFGFASVGVVSALGLYLLTRFTKPESHAA